MVEFEIYAEVIGKAIGLISSSRDRITRIVTGR